MAETVYKAAKYIRLSHADDKDNESDSVVNQRKFLDSFIANRPDIEEVAEMVDDGYSGILFDRPAFKDMMREIEEGKINCVIVKDLSRLGRNYIETGEYLEKILPMLGVRLIAVNDGYDSLNVTNGQRMVSTLKNLVNDIYAKDISRKSSAALKAKQKQGDFIGTYASYGYLKDPKDKHKIVIDPETAPTVRQIFEWKAEGMGNLPICRKLTEAKIPSPNHYRLLKGIVKDERYAKSQWASSVIKLIVTNPVYLGHMTQNRQIGALYEGKGKSRAKKEDWIIVPNTHEPLVSRELFDKANAVLETRLISKGGGMT